MEGSNLGEQYKPYGDTEEVPADVADEVCAQHANDVEADENKDGLEMRLIRDQVLGQGMPYFGLCRGCQMLNIEKFIVFSALCFCFSCCLLLL